MWIEQTGGSVRYHVKTEEYLHPNIVSVPSNLSLNSSQLWHILTGARRVGSRRASFDPVEISEAQV